MSDSVWLQRRQPTRLHHLWDSPGKNTGVGCHFLFQCMKVKRESEVAQSCPTLRDPMDWSPPGSSVHGIFQARVLEWGVMAFSSFDCRWSYFSLFDLSALHLMVSAVSYLELLYCSSWGQRKRNAKGYEWERRHNKALATLSLSPFWVPWSSGSTLCLYYLYFYLIDNFSGMEHLGHESAVL